MAISTPSNKGNEIMRSIQRSIEEGIMKEINTIFDQQVDEAVNRVNEKRNEIISKVALNVDSWYEFNYEGHTLHITFIDRTKELL